MPVEVLCDPRLRLEVMLLDEYEDDEGVDPDDEDDEGVGKGFDFGRLGDLDALDSLSCSLEAFCDVHDESGLQK